MWTALYSIVGPQKWISVSYRQICPEYEYLVFWAINLFTKKSNSTPGSLNNSIHHQNKDIVIDFQVTPTTPRKKKSQNEIP